MVPSFFRESIGGELLLLLAIVAISIVLSQVVVFAFDKVLRAFTRRTRTILDDLMIEALRRPIFLFVFVVGLYAALTSASFLNPYQEVINRGLLAVELALVVYGTNRIAGALATWYAREVAPKTESTLDERLLPIVRRIATALIYGIGGLMVVRALGLDVSPILAGLGIGGLAVALALQPTLNNLIAGAFTVSESKIGLGDYIRLEDGQRPEGVVADIGWRTTKIRTIENNIVVVPNARLADSVVTNFGAPSPETVVVVSGGVSYESDLEQVQKVVEKTAREVVQQSPTTVVGSEPLVFFRAFGDSNIEFEVVLRIQSKLDQRIVRSTLVKNLHQRFREEGIQMNYPVRRLIYTPENGAPRPF